MSAFLSIQNLSKTFGATRALIGVDLDVRPGEVHALLGQNGCGKSTLIKILSGYHQPDDGSMIRIMGEPSTGGPDQAQHAGIRFVHQDLGLVPNLSAVDNLAFGIGYQTSSFGRIKWRSQRKMASEALDSLGQPIDLKAPVGTLTPVERTTIALARALLAGEHDVHMLVLDEPTTTMTQSEAETLFAIVRQLRSRGTGILYVSHNLDEVLAIADRVTVLRDGRRVETAAAADLDKPQLVEMMTGAIKEPAADRGVDEFGPVAMRVDDVSGNGVQGFSMTLRRGEIVGLCGISGSGREAICSLIFGSAPRTGTVTVGEEILPPGKPALAVEHGIGLVPADRLRDGLVMPMSVMENMTLTAVRQFWRRLRLRHSDERRAARVSSTELGVKAHSVDVPVASLSGGNQQKVVLGKWLRISPQVLLLDEPTQGIDIAAKADVHRLVGVAAKAGTAVLVASTDEEELVHLCDRVLVFHNGIVSAELMRSELSVRRLVHEAVADGAAVESKRRVDVDPFLQVEVGG